MLGTTLEQRGTDWGALLVRTLSHSPGNRKSIFFEHIAEVNVGVVCFGVLLFGATFSTKKTTAGPVTTDRHQTAWINLKALLSKHGQSTGKARSDGVSVLRQARAYARHACTHACNMDAGCGSSPAYIPR